MASLREELDAAVNAIEERATMMLALPGGMADIKRHIERIYGWVDDREARELGKTVLVRAEELYRTRGVAARTRFLASVDALRVQLRALTGSRPR